MSLFRVANYCKNLKTVIWGQEQINQNGIGLLCLQYFNSFTAALCAWVYKDIRETTTEYCNVSIYAAAFTCCLLYTSDADDDLLCVDTGGRRIIKQKHSHHVQR